MVAIIQNGRRPELRQGQCSGKNGPDMSEISTVNSAGPSNPLDMGLNKAGSEKGVVR